MSSNRTSSDYNGSSEGTIPRQDIGLLLLITGPALLALSVFAGTPFLELAGLGAFLGGFVVMLQGEDEQFSASTATSLINSQLLLQNLLAKDKRALLGLSAGQEHDEQDDLVVGRLQGDKVVARDSVPIRSEEQFVDFRSLILSKIPSRFDSTDQLVCYVGEAIQEDLHLASTFNFSSSIDRVTLSLGGFKLRNVCNDENKDIHTSFGCVFCNTIGMILAEHTHTGVARLESRYEPRSDTTIISYGLSAPSGSDLAPGKRLVNP